MLMKQYVIHHFVGVYHDWKPKYRKLGAMAQPPSVKVSYMCKSTHCNMKECKRLLMQSKLTLLRAISLIRRVFVHPSHLFVNHIRSLVYFLRHLYQSGIY